MRKFKNGLSATETSYAAGIPGEVRFVYQPRRTIYNWKGTVVKNLESDLSYSVFYWDPATGRRFDQGIAKYIGTDASVETKGQKPPHYDYNAPDLPSPQDWVLVLEAAPKEDGIDHAQN